MTDADILKMTKHNLAIAGATWNEYLTNLIGVAKQAIGREGIVLDVDDIEDCNLIVMYTAYLYRKRADDDPQMPQMLRYALNNRLLSVKARE